MAAGFLTAIATICGLGALVWFAVEMERTSEWLGAVDEWPDLPARVDHMLDEAEKALLARQRSFNLQAPLPRERAA